MTPSFGSSGIIKSIIKNPAARRMILQAGKKAAGSVAAAATKTTSGRPPQKDRPAAEPPTPKQAPLANLTGSMETIVNNVAKPVIERLAGTSTGRSVLSAVSNIASDALRSPSGRHAEPPAKAPGTPGEPRYVAAVPETPATPPNVVTIKWPPPKNPEGR